MLTREELSEWSERNGIPELVQKIINEIRSSAPARAVESKFRNVAGIFNGSDKMGHSVHFESHTVELPAIYLYEHDPEVFEFWDQPPSFFIRYKMKNRKWVKHIYTADFFVIRQDCAGWEEWKTWEQLLKLSARHPQRYVFKNGEWFCPPAEEYAAQNGLYFKVRTDKEINPILFQNLKFLEEF